MFKNLLNLEYLNEIFTGTNNKFTQEELHQDKFRKIKHLCHVIDLMT